jgi:hypothetical protein
VRRFWILTAAAALVALFGCGRSAPRLSPDSVTALTVETLLEALVGPPPERRNPTVPIDPPLLKKGKRESVHLAVDTAGFAAMGRGVFPEKEVIAVERRVVEDTGRALRRFGFTIAAVPYPPPAAGAPEIVTATLTPRTEDAGSPQERAQGKGRTLLLVRLTIVDSAGETLAIRDYFSGREIERGGERR